jgi:hypothetical protein
MRGIFFTKKKRHLKVRRTFSVKDSATEVASSFNIVFKISYKSHSIMRGIFFTKKASLKSKNKFFNKR